MQEACICARGGPNCHRIFRVWASVVMLLKEGDNRQLFRASRKHSM